MSHSGQRPQLVFPVATDSLQASGQETTATNNSNGNGSPLWSLGNGKNGNGKANGKDDGFLAILRGQRPLYLSGFGARPAQEEED